MKSAANSSHHLHIAAAVTTKSTEHVEHSLLRDQQRQNQPHQIRQETIKTDVGSNSPIPGGGSLPNLLHPRLINRSSIASRDKASNASHPQHHGLTSADSQSPVQQDKSNLLPALGTGPPPLSGPLQLGGGGGVGGGGGGPTHRRTTPPGLQEVVTQRTDYLDDPTASLSNHTNHTEDSAPPESSLKKSSDSRGVLPVPRPSPSLPEGGGRQKEHPLSPPNGTRGEDLKLGQGRSSSQQHHNEQFPPPDLDPASPLQSNLTETAVGESERTNASSNGSLSREQLEDVLVDGLLTSNSSLASPVASPMASSNGSLGDEEEYEDDEDSEAYGDYDDGEYL